MKRSPAYLIACILLGSASLLGCRAPMPSFNAIAPYGPARVPAPCTGSYGSPNNYYQGPAQPSPGFGMQQTSGADQTAVAQSTSMPTSDKWNAVDRQAASQHQRSGVTPASVTRASVTQQEDTDDGNTTVRTSHAARLASRTSSTSDAESPIRIVQDSGSSPARRTSPQLQGMPVNDATQPSRATSREPLEPARFVPPDDVSPLADQSLRIPSANPRTSSGPTATVATSTASSTPKAAAGAKSTSGMTMVDDSGWKTRSPSRR